MELQRPDWDTYFMMIAGVAASRSTCLRRRVGAVIVRDSQIISTGYNGSPKGLPHCGEVGCLRQVLNIPSGERHEICRGSHAEMNAIAQAASVGTSTAGGTIYCTHEPCSFCTKAIINAGIRRIVFVHPYPDPLAHQLRAEASVVVDRLPETVFASVAPLLEDIFRPTAAR
ncbi:MAG TPA: cytidine deaminase [Synergistaceae bacterium]|nr:cytidine deaminase [Synergistaceae bacterium]